MNARRLLALSLVVSCFLSYASVDARQDPPPVERPAPRATNTIAGRVEWPDGSPSIGAQVTWRRENEDDLFTLLGGRSNLRATSRDGSFELKRLEPGRYTVEVRATRSDDRSVWIASASHVPVGERALKLLLRASSKISGTVVDDLGQPVTVFQVKPMRVFSETTGEGALHVPLEPLSVVDEQGRFELTGLMDGFHEVTVTTTDGRESDPRQFDVPLSKGPLRLTLPRLGSITGRVVDPAGKPVVGAEITTRDSDGSIRFGGDKPAPILTDATGAFRVDRLQPGRRFVSASSSAWADSTEIAVDLAAGATVSDIVIAVRTGGAIAGEVVDDAGRPRAGGSIEAVPSSFDVRRWRGQLVAPVDAQGRFRFERLVPGRYELTRKAPGKSNTGLSLDDLDRLVAEPSTTPEPDRKVRVVVVDGETTRVVVGRAPESAMSGRGTVRLGGRAMAGIRVIATKMYDNSEFEQNSATTGEDGGFRIGLDEPGTHYFELDLGPVQHVGAWVVGEDREQTFDFDYVVGRIVGRVVDADGRPMANVPVELDSSVLSRGYAVFDTTGNARTDADGRFVFENLPRARYRVDVVAATDGSLGAAPAYAHTTREGISVKTAAEEVTVELRPTRPCTVTGRVVDAQGLPVANLSVFARDASGTLVSRRALAVTDAEGTFRITGLPAEKVGFFARDGARATPESAPVALDPERPTPIELVAAPATRLWIRAQSEREIRLTRYQVRVFDAQDRDVRVVTWKNAPEDGEDGWLECVLPPGAYRVVVRQLARDDAETRLEIAGEPHVSRTLTLPLRR